MLGAIIGDVAGSTYEIEEVNYIRKYKIARPYDKRIEIMDGDNVPLFLKDSTVTDDSILTCAIYDAIVNGNKDYKKYLKEYGAREIKLGNDIYGRNRFGKGFHDWVINETRSDSYGNGCAMRISPVGYLFNTLPDVINESKNATIPSHNHPDSIKAAEAIATSIYLLRQGYNKKDIEDYVKFKYYDLDYDLEYLRHNYKFTSKASNSVPQAIYIFINSNSFEDAIRKAISIGGDTDTIAAITGSLAECYYGIPIHIKKKIINYMRDYMIELLDSKYKLKKVK